MLQLKNSSAFFVAFILRVLTEDLELFREHDFIFLVEGGKPTLEMCVGVGLLFLTTKSQNFISDLPKIEMSKSCRNLKN